VWCSGNTSVSKTEDRGSIPFTYANKQRKENKMFVLAITLMGGLFIYDNAEFFAQAEKNHANGLTWQAIEDGCRAPNSDEIYIASVDQATGKEWVCFKMKD
tara:strand:+ start:1376 stop:1678 length:303 start_codon:yes stop_codon:yes gene_type:complete